MRCHYCSRNGRSISWIRLDGASGIKGSQNSIPACSTCFRARFPNLYWRECFSINVDAFAALRSFVTCRDRRRHCLRCHGTGIDAERVIGAILVILANEIRFVTFRDDDRIRISLRKRPYFGLQVLDSDDLLSGLLGLFCGHFCHSPRRAIKAEVTRRLGSIPNRQLMEATA